MVRQPYISLRKLFARDMARGSISCMVSGQPGSGKTTILHGLATRLVFHDLCIFRGMPTFQEARFPWDVKTIAFHSDPVVYKPTGKPYTDIDVDHVEGGFGDLLSSCELGKLNVVYFDFKDEQTSWARFSKWLVQRNMGEYSSNFASLFVDEASEVIPAPGFGPFRNVRSLIESITNFRKTLVSLYLASQRASDCHWLLSSKIQYSIYLKGAVLPAKERRIHQNAVDRLRPGTGILSGGVFSYFFFPNLKINRFGVVRIKPRPLRHKSSKLALMDVE